MQSENGRTVEETGNRLKCKPGFHGLYIQQEQIIKNRHYVREQ